jgi:archaellum biogenesis ATPase FlaH
MMKNKEKKEKPNYGFDVQKLYLEMFLSDAETYMRCANIFEPESFDQKLQETAKFIKTYTDEYRVIPDVHIVNANCGKDLQTVSLPKENYDWLMDEFEQFSRHKGLERAIIQSSDLLDDGDYGPVEKLIKDAIQISLNKDMGTDYFADPKARLSKLKDGNGQISTGWPNIDKKLYGGFNRGELNIFCAGSGGGKSLFLANLGVNFALQGLNVLYLTFELSEGLVSMRLDSMVTGITTRDIFKQIDDVELKVKMVGKKSGGIQVKYMPSGKNCNDIRAYLKEYQVKTGVKPDVILIDYLDLMMPLSVKVSPSDLFVKDKYVSEEIRNLAMETQCITVTASQLNRSAVEEIEFDHSHISGGLSKIMTADNVIGIFTSRAMRERGRYQIQFMKTRSSSGVGQKCDLEFNVDTLRITDIDEDESGNTPQSRPAGGVYANLKKTSTVTANNVDSSEGGGGFKRGEAKPGFDPFNPAHNAGRTDDPKEGTNAPKIRADVGGAKIRAMLAGLNSEKD